MPAYLMSVSTKFWVEAENEEEAYMKAHESIPDEFLVIEEIHDDNTGDEDMETCATTTDMSELEQIIKKANEVLSPIDTNFFEVEIQNSFGCTNGEYSESKSLVYIGKGYDVFRPEQFSGLTHNATYTFEDNESSVKIVGEDCSHSISHWISVECSKITTY